MRNLKIYVVLILFVGLYSCSKSDKTSPTPTPPAPPASFAFNTLKVNGAYNGFTYINLNTLPVIKISFSAAVNTASVAGAVSFKTLAGATVAYTTTYQNNDSTVVIVPSSALSYLTKYIVMVSTTLQSSKKGSLESAVNVNLTTEIDSTNKFPVISDDDLLTLVQQQTFKYFWDFGHPTSGLARERNTSGDVVTTGGSGFGIMAIVTGISRSFVSRADGLARMQKIVAFLKTAQTFHGAFPHWMNGVTGVVVPFSTEDDGADLVETAYLMEGLLTARQYFDAASTDETNLRADITTLYDNVEWDWFRQGGQNTLYWHWSPDYGWSTNQTVSGWDEAMITYVMAASSPTHGIPKIVYDNGWALNGAIKNGNTYYGIQLPLGPADGGPLFFAHYSFLGINPHNLTDAYASYDMQNIAHAMINYNYCVANPNNNIGYSADCWGLTASDTENGGYNASSPTSDVGVIAPTAAIASLPYTPTQSLAALHFFYYKLGDKLWGQYGFYDSFDLNDDWFATSDLAIDEGPIIDMIENYRTGMLWGLFMSNPEIQTGMKSLGFTSPSI
jgi:hypothetical protein